MDILDIIPNALDAIPDPIKKFANSYGNVAKVTASDTVLAGSQPGVLPFDDANSQANYLLSLYNPENKDSKSGITCVAPDTIGFEITNQYNSLMTSLASAFGGGGSDGGASIIQLTQETLGYYLLPRILTAKIWKGSTGFAMRFNAEFHARSDPNKEVILPLRNLVSMAAPEQMFNSIIRPPNPTLLEMLAYKGKYLPRSLLLIIGRTIRIPNLIISGLKVEFDSRFTKAGYPISARVEVNLTSVFDFYKDDYLTFFLSGLVPNDDPVDGNVSKPQTPEPSPDVIPLVQNFITDASKFLGSFSGF